MTSVPSTPKRARLAVAAVGLAAALALTGCSSDSGKDKGADSGSSAGAGGAKSPSATPGEGAKGDTLEGSWVATTHGKAVALVVTGKKAGLFESGGTVCSGTAGDEMGMRMIDLKCTKDGKLDNGGRGMGKVTSVDATTLKVSWEGFGDETYRKTKDGKLPEGLPTAGLPQS
ncbi:hypothetical protein ACWCP6_17725 [Streptomyces sp. NPDC002004]